MSEPIFPDGIRVYHPSDGAPDFVKGALVIDSLKFAAWLGQQPDKVVRLVQRGITDFVEFVITYVPEYGHPLEHAA